MPKLCHKQGSGVLKGNGMDLRVKPEDDRVRAGALLEC